VPRKAYQKVKGQSRQLDFLLTAPNAPLPWIDEQVADLDRLIL